MKKIKFKRKELRKNPAQNTTEGKLIKYDAIVSTN